MNRRRIPAMLLLVVLLTSLMTISTMANVDDSTAGKTFSDVPTTHWAHEAIIWMAGQGILKGVGDGTFHPGDAVTREQFARIMVAALQLDVSGSYTQSFSDVRPDSWSYKYVETAKFFLTGYDVPGRDLDLFQPMQPAVREDMAVALVKALGFSKEVPDMTVLASFADANALTGGISQNLVPYVAIAVKHGILTGASRDGALYFDAQKTLTRAEASVLVYRSLALAGEKVTYDSLPKITYPVATHDEEDEDKPAASVTPLPTTLPISTIKAVTLADGVKLSWTAISDKRFSGYKVVLSKSNSNPKYPENGYLAYVTDRQDIDMLVSSKMGYHGESDFGGTLLSGQTYYARITTLFSDGKTHGNVIQFKLP